MKSHSHFASVSLNSERRIKNSRPTSPGSFLVAMCFFMLCIMISSCSRKNTAVSSLSPEQLFTALTAGLKAQGTAVVGSHTEYIGLSSSTYQRWDVHIILANSTPYELTLGKDFYLVESDPEASIFEGVAYCRGQEREDRASGRFGESSAACLLLSNPLNNYEIHDTDDGFFKHQGNTTTWREPSSGHRPNSSATESSGFAKVLPGNKIAIDLTLDERIWLKPDILASVRLILPEIGLMTVKGKERFRLTAFLARPNTDAKKWEISRQELSRLTRAELAKMFTTTETNTVTRIFAANWLTALERANAAPVLAGPCQSLKQGIILATGLDLLTELRSPLLADHALKLLSDKDAPNGIRSRAAIYLGRVHHERALSALLSAMQDKDTILANSAIKGAGYWGGPQAFAALSTLLLKKKAAENVFVIATALLDTGDAAAVPLLQKLAAQKTNGCLNALIGSKRPECYAFFQSLLHDGKHADWREDLINGMKSSGGTKALPDLIELLQTEKRPEEYDRTPSTLVKAIIALNPEPFAQKLADMARQGNVPAIQVFAGWDSRNAHGLLLDLAAHGTGLGQRIALDSISDNWAGESRDLLRAMLLNTDPKLVCSAIKGVRNIGDKTAADALVPFLDHKNLSVSQAAAEALEKLGPGAHAQTILERILRTNDYGTAICLTDSLIKHDWHNRDAIKPIAIRLKQLKGDMGFVMIRLLRHVSNNAMGPDGYAQWNEKSDEWRKKWCDWAAKQ
jgi:HEAT repeat protein